MSDKKTLYLSASFVFVSLIIAIFSLSIGRYSKVDFLQSVNILLDYLFSNNTIDKTTMEYNVVMYLRLPRTIGALFIGAALACAGTAFQALFSNPIASPDTLGVTHASSFGAVLAIILGFNSIIIKVSAFTMGCVVVICVYVFATRLGRGRQLTFFLLLIGMIVSSVFQSFISIVKIAADPDNQLAQITYWLMGSFSQFTKNDVLSLVLFFIIGSLPLHLIRWRLNLLTLSDIEAYSMGVNIKALRILTLACATLLTAVSTSLTGGITWFGLIVPHIARLIVGNDFKKVLVLSSCMGAFFLLAMDIIARSISIQEIPISILTSLFGAPFFVAVLIKRLGIQNDNRV